MSTIPVDVQIYVTAETAGVDGWIDSHVGREILTRAILTERNRCAQIARAAEFPSDVDTYGTVLIATTNTACRRIESAIRNEPEPAWGPAVRAATQESHASLFTTPPRNAS